MAVSVFCSSVSDTRQRLVTSTSSTSMIRLPRGGPSNVNMTPWDTDSTSSRITILWFRYCVSMGVMMPTGPSNHHDGLDRHGALGRRGNPDHDGPDPRGEADRLRAR